MADLDLVQFEQDQKKMAKRQKELEFIKIQKLMNRTPNDLTAEFIQAVCDGVRFGSTEDTVAAGLGVHPTKFQGWMSKGAADAEMKTAFGVLFVQVMAAKGELERVLLPKLKEATPVLALPRLTHKL